MDLQIKGKNVLVTASSTGIGRSIAELFVQEECNVAICARSKDNLIKTANEIKANYKVEPLWCVCDITSEKDINNTFEIVEKNFGSIDILVNNTGGPVAGIFDKITDDDWQGAVDLILMSAIRFTRKVLPAMKEKHWGRIINVTSVSVKQPIQNLMLSNSIRSAIIGFAKTLSNEVGHNNITINNIAPGYTLTNRLYELSVMRSKLINESHEHVLSEMAKEVPISRLGRPDEIAAAAVFLASECASYITGTTLQVDGGLVKSLY